MSGDLTIDVTASPEVAIVALDGECDLSAVPSLSQAVAGLEPTRELIIDATALRFMDDTGWGVLLTPLRRQRARGAAMVIVGATGAVRDALTSVGLDEVFELRATIETT